jgi:hypothetical protein
MRSLAMRMHLALLLAMVVAVAMLPLDGIAADKQVTDVKELAGNWQGWVTEQTQERASMIISADGSYKASTQRGVQTEGKFYLRDGKLLYQSSRTAGTARLSEDRGKTTLTMTPENPDYGKAEYDRVR